MNDIFIAAIECGLDPYYANLVATGQMSIDEALRLTEDDDVYFYAMIEGEE